MSMYSKTQTVLGAAGNSYWKNSAGLATIGAAYGLGTSDIGHNALQNSLVAAGVGGALGASITGASRFASRKLKTSRFNK